jgi:hypothetical protein
MGYRVRSPAFQTLAQPGGQRCFRGASTQRRFTTLDSISTWLRDQRMESRWVSIFLPSTGPKEEDFFTGRMTRTRRTTRSPDKFECIGRLPGLLLLVRHRIYPHAPRSPCVARMYSSRERGLPITCFSVPECGTGQLARATPRPRASIHRNGTDDALALAVALLALLVARAVTAQNSAPPRRPPFPPRPN